MSRHTSFALVFVLVLAPTLVRAQGLVAYPFFDNCPNVDGLSTCVWVTNSFRTVNRNRENVEGNLRIDALNPGLETANVTVNQYGRDGIFVRQDRDIEIKPGNTLLITPSGIAATDRLTGTFIISSNVPLLLWAYKFEQHLRRGIISGNGLRAASRQNVPVFPVDCSGIGDPALKSNGWVCANIDLPPPPD